MPRPISRKDYQKNNFNNPQFPKKEDGRGGRPIFIPIIFLILFFASFFFLNQAELLQIRDIDVQGISQEANEDIENLVREQLKDKKLLFFSQSNILFFDKSQLHKSITDNYLFDNIKIKKRPFNKLKIVIDQKALGIIWSVNESQYYLDLDGIVIRQLDNSDLNVEKFEDGTQVIRAGSVTGDYPLIYDQTNKEVVIGKPATSDQMVKFVVLLTQTLKAESNFVVSHFYSDRPFFPEVTMVTKDGWEAKFKIDDDPFKQVKLLNSVLDQKINNRDELKYIDLRFGEKIFYK